MLSSPSGCVLDERNLVVSKCWVAECDRFDAAVRDSGPSASDAGDSASDAGIAAAGSGMAFAAAVQRLLQRPPDQRRRDARERAERYSWPDSVRGFLAVHDLESTPVAS